MLVHVCDPGDCTQQGAGAGGLRDRVLVAVSPARTPRAACCSSKGRACITRIERERLFPFLGRSCR